LPLARFLAGAAQPAGFNMSPINYEPPNGTALQDLDVIPADLVTNVTAKLFDLAVGLRIKIPTHRPQRSLFVFHVIALDCFDQFFDFVFHFIHS
jgi:hypothetical protein